jgi:hypothetical protein
MSDTEQLFIVAAVWTVIAAVLARFVPNWGGRIALFAVLVGVPFWELPYGYMNFRSICEKETRVLVFESIPAQRVVCVDYPFEDAAPEVLKVGFESVEARGKAGDVRRYAASGAGNQSGGRQDRITADYCISSATNIGLPWRVLRHDHLVNRTNDGRNVARQSRFLWAGMWWQEAARPILGRGGECSGSMNHIFEAVRKGATKGGS